MPRMISAPQPSISRSSFPGTQDVMLARLLLFALLSLPAVADDWPQWRGPRRDGISRERGWLASWPENGAAAVAWRAQVGKGHSTIPVSNGLAYTMGWD